MASLALGHSWPVVIAMIAQKQPPSLHSAACMPIWLAPQAVVGVNVVTCRHVLILGLFCAMTDGPIVEGESTLVGWALW